MILNTNTQIMIMNPQTEEISYFNDTKKELLSKNKDWYNIYYILNDFKSKRTLWDLIWFKWIGIDLDMQLSSVSTLFQWPIDDVFKLCQDKLWFLPSKINRTFKGFHIFFKLSGDLYSLDREQYVILYKHINKVLWGDPKMKDITAILKMEGFIDNKEGRKEFVIKNEFLDNKNILWVKEVENILWETIRSDTKRIEDYQISIVKKDRNNGMFEDIDALEFIKSINEDNNAFKWVNIEVKNNWIVWTSGLKIYNDNGIHRIKDFSGKNRFGNRLFLYNYVIKEVMGIEEFKVPKKTKFKDDNEKKEYDLKVEGVEKIGKVMGFLSNEFWIKYNKGLDTLPIYDAFVEYNIQKNNFVLLEQGKGLDISIVENYNKLIETIWKKWEIQKLIIWLNLLINKENINATWKFRIKEKELLEYMWLSNKTEFVEKNRGLMLLLSNLNFEATSILEDWRKKVSYIRLFDFSIIHSKWKLPTEYELKINYPIKKKIWIGEHLPSLFKKPEHFYFATTISSKLSEFGWCNFNVEEIMWNLWISQKKDLKKILDKMKDNNYLKEYSFKNDTVYIK